MKTLILTSLIIIGSLGLKGQQPRREAPELRAKRIVNYSLKPTLNLTNQQIKKISQIYMNHYKSSDSLVSVMFKRGADANAITSALTSMQHATDKKISSVLNDDQKLAYAKHISSRKVKVISTPVSAPPSSR